MTTARRALFLAQVTLVRFRPLTTEDVAGIS
jgi:hypothetical protein